MIAKDSPLILRCLALVGAFETGKTGLDSMGVVSGNFDGQGLSFSCLQWNLGQGTLQPLLQQIPTEVINACFGTNASALLYMLSMPKALQLGWARGIQGATDHKLAPDWASGFAALGATPEWQAVAMKSVTNTSFDQARHQATQLKLTSDRGIALCFDSSVQCGGISVLAMNHILDVLFPPSGPPLAWDEVQKLKYVAQTVADGSNPRWRPDVLARKLCIANGSGTVHGMHFDLAKDFGL